MYFRYKKATDKLIINKDYAGKLWFIIFLLNLLIALSFAQQTGSYTMVQFDGDKIIARTNHNKTNQNED